MHLSAVSSLALCNPFPSFDFHWWCCHAAVGFSDWRGWKANPPSMAFVYYFILHAPSALCIVQVFILTQMHHPASHMHLAINTKAIGGDCVLFFYGQLAARNKLLRWGKFIDPLEQLLFAYMCNGQVKTCTDYVDSGICVNDDDEKQVKPKISHYRAQLHICTSMLKQEKVVLCFYNIHCIKSFNLKPWLEKSWVNSVFYRNR